MKKLSLFILGLAFCVPTLTAQAIITHQYRRVEPENMQEYLKRETTYWQKLAESEVTKGNLTFWAILRKVGGINQDKGSNILIINTFNNLETSNEIWGNLQALFPDTKMEDMATWDMAKNTATIHLRSADNFVSIPDADPDKDFKYVYLIYHNPKDTGKHMKFESEEWKPLIEKAMAEGKTNQKGWGNDYILAPDSPKFPYSTSSYDLFSSLTDALNPEFSEDFVWPEGFGDGVQDNSAGKWHKQLYRIVTKVSAPTPAE